MRVQAWFSARHGETKAGVTSQLKNSESSEETNRAEQPRCCVVALMGDLGRRSNLMEISRPASS